MANNVLLVDYDRKTPYANWFGVVQEVNFWKNKFWLSNYYDKEEVERLMNMSDEDFISFLEDEWEIKVATKEETIKFIKENIFPIKTDAYPKNMNSFLNANVIV